MYIEITRNLCDLTDTEKEVLRLAQYFVHAVGLLLIHTSNGNDIAWDCTNAADAYLYLKNELKVREL